MVESAQARDGLAFKGQSERLLYQFNLLPAAYADSSWVESVCGIESVENRPNQASCIDQSVALLKHHGLSGKFDWSLRAATVRLALLEQSAFNRICTVLGLMGTSPVLRKTIDARVLRSLNKTFGDLTEAIWAPESLVLAQAGAEYNLLLHAEQEQLEQARMAGFRAYRALLYAESKESPESMSRALFRLPMPVAAEPVTPIDSAVVRPVMRWVCQSAVKRWEPSWAWLF